MTFGVDGSHGYERTNLDSLLCVAWLLLAYAEQTPLYEQRKTLGSIESFPPTRDTDVVGTKVASPDPIPQTPLGPVPECELTDEPGQS